MRGWLRTLRGALGIGLTWGAVWGVIFSALGLVAWIVDPTVIGPGEGAAVILRTGVLLGLVSGGVFSGLLLVAARGKDLPQLSPVRVGLLGAVATAVFPLVSQADPSMLFLLCPVGGVIAGGSVAWAKRADRDALARGETPEALEGETLP